MSKKKQPFDVKLKDLTCPKCGQLVLPFKETIFTSPPRVVRNYKCECKWYHTVQEPLPVFN